MSTHDLTVCMKLVSINTLNAGALVELKWLVPECGDVESGEMRIRVAPSIGEKYLLGDKLFVHMRGEP